MLEAKQKVLLVDLRNYDLHNCFMSNKQFYHIFFYLHSKRSFNTSTRQILKIFFLL